jgi:hypothetical protein
LLENPYITAFVFISVNSTNETLAAKFPLLSMRKKRNMEGKNLLFDA